VVKLERIRVDMCNSAIGDIGAKLIVNGLLCSASVVYLQLGMCSIKSLGFCKLRTEGAKCLGLLLVNSVKLRGLYLGII